MRGRFILLILLIGIISKSAAYVFDENIVVDGNGSIDSKTNAMGARDSIQATGAQTYTRNISDEGSNADKIATFSSKYKLDGSAIKSENHFRSFKTKSNSKDNSSSADGWTKYSKDIPLNRYAIAMSRPINIQHNIAFSGIKTLESNNSISFNKGKINTKYSNRGEGRFKETLVNFTSRTKPNFIADTEVNASSFVQQSGFGDTQILGSDIDNLIQWARNEPAIPASVGSNPKIDLKRGIIGRNTPSGNQSPGAKPQGTPTTVIASDATAGATGAPKGGNSSSTEGSNAKSLNNSTSGLEAASPKNMTIKSVPDQTQPFGSQPATMSSDAIASTTGAPKGNGSDSTGRRAESVNDGITNSSVSGAGSETGFAGDIYPASSSILIAPFKDEPIPTAILGRVAKFDLLNHSIDPSVLKEFEGYGYNAFDRNGVRTVESNKCNSSICQDYTHISYAYRFGDPIPAVSPMVQLDKLITPLIP